MASVVIAVFNAEDAAENTDIDANSEVNWHEWASIWLNDDLALEEETLGYARVDLLWLSDHDGLILEIVEDNGFSDSEVFEARLDYMLFKVGVESQDL